MATRRSAEGIGAPRIEDTASGAPQEAVRPSAGNHAPVALAAGGVGERGDPHGRDGASAPGQEPRPRGPGAPDEAGGARDLAAELALLGGFWRASLVTTLLTAAATRPGAPRGPYPGPLPPQAAGRALGLVRDLLAFVTRHPRSPAALRLRGDAVSGPEALACLLALIEGHMEALGFATATAIYQTLTARCDDDLARLAESLELQLEPAPRRCHGADGDAANADARAAHASPLRLRASASPSRSGGRDAHGTARDAARPDAAGTSGAPATREADTRGASQRAVAPGQTNILGATAAALPA